VGLASVDAAADDPKELAVEVLLDCLALVRCEDADAVNRARLHEDGILVRVQVGMITDVTIDGGVEVLRVPQRAAVVEVVGEQDLHATVERHQW